MEGFSRQQLLLCAALGASALQLRRRAGSGARPALQAALEVGYPALLLFALFRFQRAQRPSLTADAACAAALALLLCPSDASPGRSEPPEPSVGLRGLEDVLEDALLEDLQLAKEYECPICLSTLLDPLQLVCDGQLRGHKVCSRCFQDIPRCPFCNLPCQPGAVDDAAKRAIEALACRCPYCKDWRGPLGLLPKHCGECKGEGRPLLRCPVEGCGFRAAQEREVRAHLLQDFAGHVRLAAPQLPKHFNGGHKDMAQLYLANWPGMMRRGENVLSPAFYAGAGYCCLFEVHGVEQQLKCLLKFYRGASHAGAWPFPHRFVVHIQDPDAPARIVQSLVDFHLTLPSRDSDPNINPEEGRRTWTAGIDTRFTRQQCESINMRHLVVVVTILN